ncbi:MAG: hypothetical protein WBM40_04985 [Thiohalocapsa sp.]
MEQIKKSDNKLIFKKKSGRYAVQDCTTKQWINGDAKASVLLAEGLITHAEPKPAPAPDAAEAADETTAEA